MTDRQKIADKIAKLLRIAERDEGPQGRTAASIAAQLQKRYRIDAEEIDLNDDTVSRITWICSDDAIYWRANVAHAVATAYDATLQIGRRPDGQFDLVVEVPASGSPSRIKIHHDFIVASLEHMTQDAQDTAKRDRRRWPGWDGFSFAMGASQHLRDVFDRLAGPTIVEDEVVVDATVKVVGGTAIARMSAMGRRRQRAEAATATEELPIPRLSGRWMTIGKRTAERRLGGPHPALFEKVDSLPLPKNTIRALREAHVFFVGDLLRYTSRELRLFRGIGYRSVSKISRALLDVDSVLRPARSEIR